MYRILCRAKKDTNRLFTYYFLVVFPRVSFRPQR